MTAAATTKLPRIFAGLCTVPPVLALLDHPIGVTGLSIEHRAAQICNRLMYRPGVHRDDTAHQLIARIRFLIFSACGPSSLASLSSKGSATAAKPDLSTSVTILTPIDFSFSCDWCSSSIAL